MRGLMRILSLFRNDFNKYNYTGAGMLDYIYRLTLILLLNYVLLDKRLDFAIYIRGY